MLTLADMIEALHGVRPAGSNLGISEAVVDSRHAIPGSLFVAIKGERTDGHEYVADAFKHGAHLALIEKEISAEIPVIDLTTTLTLPCLSRPRHLR